MGKLYSSGLIGLDMKPKRRIKIKQNRKVLPISNRWLLLLAGIVVLISLILFAGMR